MTPDELAQELELAEYEATQRAAIMAEALQPSAEFCTAPDCGAPIPEGRRKARPGVQYCVDCQARLEQQQRGGR